MCIKRARDGLQKGTISTLTRVFMYGDRRLSFILAQGRLVKSLTAQYHSAKRRSREKAREQDKETEETEETEEAMVQETRTGAKEARGNGSGTRSEPFVYDIARANPTRPSPELQGSRS